QLDMVFTRGRPWAHGGLPVPNPRPILRHDDVFNPDTRPPQRWPVPADELPAASPIRGVPPGIPLTDRGAVIRRFPDSLPPCGLLPGGIHAECACVPMCGRNPRSPRIRIVDLGFPPGIPLSSSAARRSWRRP